MAIKTSTGTRISMLAGPGIKPTFDGEGVFRIYAGLEPVGADDSLGSATLLCEIKKDGTTNVTLDSTTTPGILMKPAADTWTGNNVATGTASFYRFVKSADAGGASTSAERVQGTVGLVGADLNIDSVSLVSGQPTPIRYYVMSVLGA